MPRAGLLLVLFAIGCAAPRPDGPPGPAEARVEDWLRVRCSTDGRDVYTSFSGQVLAVVPDAPFKHLFDIVGMNVARCARDAHGWYQTSRELLYYLDPATGEPLTRWTNPFTGERVTVAHVANSPVQTRIGHAPPLRVAHGLASFVVDVPLFYPNPLAASEALRAVDPSPFYRAAELFVLTAPTGEALDPARAATSEMSLSWHRLGPWLPWMDMGDRPGMLLYSATGQRLRGFDELPALLRAEIAARLPRYRSAPRCFLRAKNETSWTSFARDVEAWRRGERFPLPAPIVDEPCAE